MGYAHLPVPPYPLIEAGDEAGSSVTLEERIGNGRCDHATTVDLGAGLRLPGPFGIAVDTSGFPVPDQWPS